MKDKITLTRPDGETVEMDVVCHFKSVDDACPNIKNIPVLVVDKKENNNGNNVLEFYWEKEGSYQPINDEAAWDEVKKVIVSVIKNEIDMAGVVND